MIFVLMCLFFFPLCLLHTSCPRGEKRRSYAEFGCMTRGH